MTGDTARTVLRNVRFKDGFQNFEAMYGLGTDNQMSSSRYGFTPLTRDRQQLDLMYRGSWVVRRAVSVPADDMTRAGIDIFGHDPAHDPVVLQNALRRLKVWSSLASTIRWARLYGGAIAVLLIEGQRLSEPFRPETVARGQFKGLLPLDRWALTPSSTMVDAFGPDFGKPVGYQVVAGSGDQLQGAWIHHTRIVRLEGDDLSYWQRQYENGWGMSVVESFHDRLVAFDSTTLGMAQMVYKAHLRTMKMKDLRKNIASGGPAFAAALTNVNLIRRYQTTEGLTLIDSEDEFQTDTYTFGGLPDVMMQMSQQIAGAVEIPLVKFFGMSPAGFSTGDSDLRSYYDDINLKQERHLRHPIEVISNVTYRSEFGAAPPPEFGFTFTSLYGLNAVEKANIASATTTAIAAAEGAAPEAFRQSHVLKELKRSAEVTGIFGSITDEDIKAAEDAEKADAERVRTELPDAPGAEQGGEPVSEPGTADPEQQEEFERRPFPLGRPELVHAS